MKFVHRLNVRALSAMVTGIMVASSMLAAASPVAAAVEAKNIVTVSSGLGLSGSTIRTDIGTFSSAPASVTYLWYRCTYDLSGTTLDTLPSDSGSDCVSTGVTRNSYTLSALDLLRPYVVALVTRDGGDSHYSDAFVMKRKPGLVTTAPAADHYPEITSSNVTYARGGVSASTLTVTEGDWVGEPYPDITFNWLRCTSSASTPSTSYGGCTAITAADGGVDSSTYQPTTKDVGYFIRVRITARNQFGIVKLVSPSWAGGHATPSNALNKVSGAPFTKGLISFAGRRANPNTWVALPALDTTYGYTAAVATADGHSGSGTPGFSYQWYGCVDAVEFQSNTEAAWLINNSDGGAEVLCTELPGQTSRFLGEEYSGMWFVVKITAQNTSLWTGSVYSKSTYIR